MIEPRDILVGAVIPGVVALLLMLIAWRPWRRREPVTGSGWAMPLAVGFAVAFAYAALQMHVLVPGVDVDAKRVVFPSTPPADAKAWLLYLSLPVGVFGLLIAVIRKVRWWLYVPLALLVIAGIFKLLMPRQDWPTAAAVAAIVWGVWVLFEPLAARSKGMVVPLALWFSATGAAAILMDTGSVKVGQYAGALAAVAGAAVVVALLGKGNVSLARGGAFAFFTLLGGLLVTGYFYSSVSKYQAIGIVLVPLVAWIDQVPRVARLKPWKRVLVSVLALAVATAVVAGPAMVGLAKTAIRESTGGGEESMYSM